MPPAPVHAEDGGAPIRLRLPAKRDAHAGLRVATHVRVHSQFHLHAPTHARTHAHDRVQDERRTIEAISRMPRQVQRHMRKIYDEMVEAKQNCEAIAFRGHRLLDQVWVWVWVWGGGGGGAGVWACACTRVCHPLLTCIARRLPGGLLRWDASLLQQGASFVHPRRA